MNLAVVSVRTIMKVEIVETFFDLTFDIDLKLRARESTESDCR